MRVSFDGAKLIQPGAWIVQLTPDDLRTLGGASGKPALRPPLSVLLVTTATFESQEGVLSAPLAGLAVLVAGDGDQAIVLSADKVDSPASTELGRSTLEARTASTTDRSFVLECRRLLQGDLPEAAERLVHGVRSKRPGQLIEGEQRKWIDRPDNFWTATIQPRINQLEITVRGIPEKFVGFGLEVKADRPSYSRFKVRSINDVDKALRIIFASLGLV